MHTILRATQCELPVRQYTRLRIHWRRLISAGRCFGSGQAGRSRNLATGYRCSRDGADHELDRALNLGSRALG